MNYLNHYKDQKGKCEFCKFYRTNSDVCDHCFGINFEHKLNFYDYLRNMKKKEAIEEFESCQGCAVRKEIESLRTRMNDLSVEYDKKMEEFVNERLKNLDESLNKI